MPCSCCSVKPFGQTAFLNLSSYKSSSEERDLPLGQGMTGRKKCTQPMTDRLNRLNLRSISDMSSIQYILQVAARE